VNSHRKNLARTLSDLVLLASLLLALSLLAGKCFAPGATSASWNALKELSSTVYLLLSLPLLANLTLHVRDSIEDWSRWDERPPPPKDAPFLREYRLNSTCSIRSLTPLYVQILGEFFARFYAFHQSHPAYVTYYYFAKKGTASLFGLPWMKTGFLSLFLVYGLYCGKKDLYSQEICIILLVGVLLLFWLPGLWLSFMVPHQKIWLDLTEAEERLHLRILCLSSSHEDRLNELAKTLATRFSRTPR